MTRRIVVFCAAVAALVGLGLLAVRQLRSGGGPPSSTPTSPDAAPAGSDDRVELVGIVGVVERRVKGSPWARARVGEVLERHASVRTGLEARAELRIGRRAGLTVDRDTEVSVVEITEALDRFQLAQGRLQLDYKASGKRQVQVETELAGPIAARASGASFSVLRTPTAVAVATHTGVVDLRAPSGSTTVAAGRQSVVTAGAPAAPAVALPKEVLLRLAQLDAPVRATRTTLRGETQPGNRVFVAGRVVAVDRRGRFDAPLSLRRGRNRIEVITESPDGRSRSQLVELAAGPGPATKLDVIWHKRPTIDVNWGTGSPINKPDSGR